MQLSNLERFVLQNIPELFELGLIEVGLHGVGTLEGFSDLMVLGVSNGALVGNTSIPVLLAKVDFSINFLNLLTESPDFSLVVLPDLH